METAFLIFAGGVTVFMLWALFKYASFIRHYDRFKAGHENERQAVVGAPGEDARADGKAEVEAARPRRSSNS